MNLLHLGDDNLFAARGNFNMTSLFVLKWRKRKRSLILNNVLTTCRSVQERSSSAAGCLVLLLVYNMGQKLQLPNLKHSFFFGGDGSLLLVSDRVRLQVSLVIVVPFVTSQKGDFQNCMSVATFSDESTRQKKRRMCFSSASGVLLAG